MTTLTKSQVHELLAVLDNQYAANIEKFNAAFAIARPLAESWLEMRELLAEAIPSLEGALDKGGRELAKDIRTELHATDRDDGDHEPRDTGDSPAEIAHRQAEAQKLKR